MSKIKLLNNIKIKLLLVLILILMMIKILIIISFKTKKISKNLKICLCIMGKNENLYAKEYINHYKRIGYNHIFLYDNNDIDGERFDDELHEELNEGFLTIINYRGIGNGPQLKIYYDCYEKNNQEYDWLSFFDFDEFLELPNNKNIQEFLANKRYKKCQNIKINALYYSDNELLFYDNRPVQKRFTTPLLNYTKNYVIKSTVKGKLKDNYWKKSQCAHTSLMNCINCNSNGEIIKYNAGRNYKYNYTYAVLKHYYTKSVEEFYNKIKRGEAFYKNISLNERRIISKIRKYFEINKKTKKKIELFLKLFCLENKYKNYF